jgi:hypothetical protein
MKTDSGDGLHFLRRKPVIFLLVSVVVLIPCFWLPRIEAGDLGSHTYNAWLASLVEQGKAPGLWIAPQTNNILFDVLLLRLGTLLGFIAAERIAVCIAVLVFLWGTFAFISSFEEEPAWFLLPLLIVLAYGWTFHMGFFNFYLSIGFSFAALAVAQRAKGLAYLYVLPFLALIWLAHPLGLVWFVGVAVYLFLAKVCKPQWHWLLAGAFLASLLLIHFYLGRSYRVTWWRGQFYDLFGTDQILLGLRYRFLTILIALVVVGCVVFHFFRLRSQSIKGKQFLSVPLQLFLLAYLAVLLLPDRIWLPQYSAPVGFISSRFSLGVAVLGCVCLSSLRPRLLLGVLSACVACIYFGMVYEDAAKTYALEKQVTILTGLVPQDARILTTIFPFQGWYIFTHHVADRACIGHCFNIDNYEPATKQFRLRADANNRIVVVNPEDSNHMMFGDYVVRQEDLPLSQIFQCGPKEIDVCLRPLHPGSNSEILQNEVERARSLAP